MKLQNQSLFYLSASILFIVAVWSVIFYFNMLSEIKSSIDEELENHKRLIILRADKYTIQENNYFDERNYTVKTIGERLALSARTQYKDTLVYMQDDDDQEMELEPVRMLSTVFESNGNYYQLKIINPMVEEDDLIKSLFWGIFWLYIIVVVSIIIVNGLVLKRLWKPFYDFLEQLKKFRLNTKKQLPQIISNTKEFNDLSLAVHTLLQHSVEAFEQQKQFIGNASHELQTPLAITTNKLELLLEQHNLGEEQAGNIAEILEIIERMVRLNQSLLFLAKIENKQFFNNEPVAFNIVVQQVMIDFQEFADFKNITIKLQEEKEVMLQMDVSLASIIASNLIKNAIIHNKTNGEVKMQLSNNSFTVRNTGSIVPLDDKKVFTRFYKSSVNNGGTGLGLAIVKAICNLYGFQLKYQFDEDQLHSFTVVFDTTLE
ncbi:sensor histidine kinase [Flavobacterium sp. U410]